MGAGCPMLAFPEDILLSAAVWYQKKQVRKKTHEAPDFTIFLEFFTHLFI